MSKVQHAVQHSFDLFTQTMDRLILEGFLTGPEVYLDLIQQGLIDFADMWQGYMEGDLFAMDPIESLAIVDCD